MLRFLFRLAATGLVLGGVAFALGYRWDGPSGFPWGTGDGAARALGGSVNAERLRKAGTEITGTIGESAGRAGTALTEARLTAKIRSKMALDDTLDSRHLDVDTEGSVVTLRGSVDTAAQHRRALQLARETDGVTSVVDRIAVSGR